MEEETEKPLEPWVNLLLVSLCLISLMNIMGHYKLNQPPNIFFSLIRFASKLSLFAWAFYGGRIFERTISKKLALSFEEKMKGKVGEIKELEERLRLREEQKKELKEKHKSELVRLKENENTLIEKLRQYQRTGKQANEEAFKSFL